MPVFLSICMCVCVSLNLFLDDSLGWSLWSQVPPDSPLTVCVCVCAPVCVQVFVCLWKGCKVYNTPSTSHSWLQRHMLTHSGDKPFKVTPLHRDQCPNNAPNTIYSSGVNLFLT